VASSQNDEENTLKFGSGKIWEFIAHEGQQNKPIQIEFGT